MYIVVMSLDMRGLVETVNERLKEGFKLIGGISIGANREEAWKYAQAMILEEKEDS
mgnify:CR=1 FL=1